MMFSFLLSGIQNLTFTYDKNGNITTILDSSKARTAHETNYIYDTLNRLTQAQTTFASTTGYAETYAYNPLGNFTSKTGIGNYTYAGTTTGSYANPHAPTTINGISVVYDNNGNITNYASTTNSWDYRNRLVTSYSSTSPAVLYTYDHTEQRVTKFNGTATTTYVSKYFEVATSTTGAATTTKNIYSPTGDLLATITTTGATSTRNYIHPDILGSTNVTTDYLGAITGLDSYYPYGNERVAIGSTTDRHYISQVQDPETSLSYLNNRYYNPMTGQFISQDPVFWTLGTTRQNGALSSMSGSNSSGNITPGGVSMSGVGRSGLNQEQMAWLADPQTQNSSSYARDNPINRKDPEGLWGIFAQRDVSGAAGLFAGFSGSGSAGVGVTWGNSPSDPIELGGYTSYGGLVGGMFHSTTLEGSAKGPNNYSVFGLGGGFSYGVTATNATKISQLGGTSLQNSLSVGIGTVSWSNQGGIWTITIAIGGKPAVSFSDYPTNTKTATIATTEKKK